MKTLVVALALLSAPAFADQCDKFLAPEPHSFEKADQLYNLARSKGMSDSDIESAENFGISAAHRIHGDAVTSQGFGVTSNTEFCRKLSKIARVKYKTSLF